MFTLRFYKCHHKVADVMIKPLMFTHGLIHMQWFIQQPGEVGWRRHLNCR